MEVFVDELPLYILKLVFPLDVIYNKGHKERTHVCSSSTYVHLILIAFAKLNKMYAQTQHSAEIFKLVDN